MKQHTVLFGFWNNPGLAQGDVPFMNLKDGAMARGGAGYEPKGGHPREEYGLGPIPNLTEFDSDTKHHV
jgi:hypothetical protein